MALELELERPAHRWDMAHGTLPNRKKREARMRNQARVCVWFVAVVVIGELYLLALAFVCSNYFCLALYAPYINTRPAAVRFVLAAGMGGGGLLSN